MAPYVQNDSYVAFIDWELRVSAVCHGKDHLTHTLRYLIINISINPLLVSTYDQHEIKTGTTHWKCLPP
jgi:hypothetical protein